MERQITTCRPMSDQELWLENTVGAKARTLSIDVRQLTMNGHGFWCTGNDSTRKGRWAMVSLISSQ